MIYRDPAQNEIQAEMNLQLTSVLAQARLTAPRVLWEVPYLRALVVGYFISWVGSFPVDLPWWVRLFFFLSGAACGLISMHMARPRRRAASLKSIR
jgi:ABC-type antimicrobial peptide transport system permease subunit